jgi:2-polyprenyl-6-methoxyphenol hydroxylase-like FAD-dependent oxidoreductase
MHVVIMGAGPAGLAAALALHQQSTKASPIQITVLELRPGIQTLGGAVNLTPLAMRYLDALDVGSRLRPLGAKVDYIEMLSHRTGGSLGKLWPDVDAIRVLRQNLVEALTETVQSLPAITLRYGVKVASFTPSDDAITLHLPADETITADVLLGCDGIHSHLRTAYVDPARHKTYSGRATAYAYLPVPVPGDAGIATSGGSPAVSVTSLVNAQFGSLLVSFFTPAKEKLYLAAVVARE